MNSDLLLLPHPRHLEIGEDRFVLRPSGLIALVSEDPQAIYASAARLQGTLHAVRGAHWEIVAGDAQPAREICARLVVAPGSQTHEQGYSLTITRRHIDILANTPAGIFYAVMTLSQVLLQTAARPGAGLPALHCRDWPDFPRRGVLLDISRDKVPSMETLYGLVDMLASWKINQLQLYSEHTFAYRAHPLVWAGASPMTGEQILALDAYCRERFIELVPNQNSFAHMRRWLVHEPYRQLAECPDGCDTRWGRFDEPFSLSPSHPDSLALVSGLFDELLPHFSSRQVNIGGDEPVDLESGQGRSGALVQKLGLGRVYLDFLLKIYRQVKRRNRTMQFWADIIMAHPELVGELPRDAIALEWGYEADHPFDRHGALLAAAGVPFYVCPGTSSWRSISGRSDNAVTNLRNAAHNGLKHGALGYLITDWGDEGHWQPLPVSYLGFGYGAALAWGYEANLEADIPKLLDLYAFHDRRGILGSLAYELGNIYQAPGVMEPNGSILFNALQAAPAEIEAYLLDRGDLNQAAERLRETLELINRVSDPLLDTDTLRPGAILLRKEFAWAADMLRHACWRTLWVIGEASGGEGPHLRKVLLQGADDLIERFETIWHARNRPGGFKDSLKRMQTMRDHYLES